MHKQARSSVVQDCIQECQDCHAICVETVAHCLTVGGAHAKREHVAVLSDCAEICHLSEDAMRRDSMTAKAVCAACADVCDACATECESFAGDAEMKACADRCRSCAQACRQMVAARP